MVGVGFQSCERGRNICSAFQTGISYTSVTVDSGQQHLNTGVYLASPMKQSKARKALAPVRTNTDKGSIFEQRMVDYWKLRSCGTSLLELRNSIFAIVPSAMLPGAFELDARDLSRVRDSLCLSNLGVRSLVFLLYGAAWSSLITHGMPPALVS